MIPLVAAAVLAAPISFYLGATPMLRWFGFFFPGLLLIAAAVVRRRRLAAIVFVGLFMVPSAWLLVAVLSSNAGGGA